MLGSLLIFLNSNHVWWCGGIGAMVTDYYISVHYCWQKLAVATLCDYNNTDCMYYNVHNSYRKYIVVQKVIHYNNYNYIMFHQRWYQNVFLQYIFSILLCWYENLAEFLRRCTPEWKSQVSPCMFGWVELEMEDTSYTTIGSVLCCWLKSAITPHVGH